METSEKTQTVPSPKRSRRRKALVACHLGDNASKFLSMAGRMAVEMDADIIIAHIIEERDIEAIRHAVNRIFLIEEKISIEHYIRQFRSERIEKITEMTSAFDWSDRVRKIDVRIGTPFLEIIKLAEAEDVDMVLIGASRHPKLATLFLGSTAEKIFRHCPVTVASIRQKP